MLNWLLLSVLPRLANSTLEEIRVIVNDSEIETILLLQQLLSDDIFKQFLFTGVAIWLTVVLLKATLIYGGYPVLTTATHQYKG